MVGCIRQTDSNKPRDPGYLAAQPEITRLGCLVFCSAIGSYIFLDLSSASGRGLRAIEDGFSR